MSNKHSLLLLLALIVPSFGGAYETDQFSNRLQLIEDSTAVMNRQVTLAIANTITGLHGRRDEMKVVNGIYHKIGGIHWVDKLEHYAMDSSEVERLNKLMVGRELKMGEMNKEFTSLKARIEELEKG